MIDLRAGAIEAIRVADHDYVRVAKQEHPEGKAGFQLDAIVDYLEAHAAPMVRVSALAQEWAVCEHDEADALVVDLNVLRSERVT